MATINTDYLESHFYAESSLNIFTPKVNSSEAPVKSGIVNCKDFQEISMAGMPVLVLKDYSPDNQPIQSLESLSFGDRLHVSGQILSLVIPREMYRTNYPGEKLADAKARGPIADFSQFDMHVESVMFTMIDRAKVYDDQLFNISRDLHRCDVPHYCSHNGDIQRNCQPDHGCTARCRGGVQLLSEPKELINTDMDWFTVIYDWASFYTEKDFKKTREFLYEYFGTYDAVNLVACLTPDRTVVWTPLFKDDIIQEAKKLLETQPSERVYQTKGVQFLDGPDIYVTNTFRLWLCGARDEEE